MEDKKIDKELIESIIKTKRELIVANKNFETAEYELVDYYSYMIKASKAKLDYLIKQVKQKGIQQDMINNLYIDLINTRVV